MSQPDITEVLQEFSDSFDKLCQERHNVGVAEYGAFTFLGNDVVRMMMEELADTANYCRMQFVKLMFLQAYLQDEMQDKTDDGDNIQIGLKAFRGTKEWGWDRGRGHQ